MRISRLTRRDWTWHDPYRMLLASLDVVAAMWPPTWDRVPWDLPTWDLVAPDLVSMVGITDMPGRRSTAASLPASSAILTGMRCTTLVKLPVALSGGSSANSWPLAGAML